METTLPKIHFNSYWRLKIGLYLLSAIAILVICERSSLDFTIANWFYSDTQKWILPYGKNPYHFWLYELPKILLLVNVSSLVLLLILSFPYQKLRKIRDVRLYYFLLSIAIIPAFIAGLKAITHVACPYQLKNFGGHFTYKLLWEKNILGEAGRCFPAGHASGGFALFSLCFLTNKYIYRLIAFFFVCVVGGSMGMYQMLTGRHFFSHTLITIIIAWAINDILYDFLFKRDMK